MNHIAPRRGSVTYRDSGTAAVTLTVTQSRTKLRLLRVGWKQTQLKGPHRG